MARRNARTNLRRASYLDQDNFARDLHAGGGPGLGDLDCLPAGPGYHSELLRAIWGTSSADFEASVAHELAQAQRMRPRIFVEKWRTRRRS
jgi:hypothetical protein